MAFPAILLFGGAAAALLLFALKKPSLPKLQLPVPLLPPAPDPAETLAGPPDLFTGASGRQWKIVGVAGTPPAFDVYTADSHERVLRYDQSTPEPSSRRLLAVAPGVDSATLSVCLSDFGLQLPQAPPIEDTIPWALQQELAEAFSALGVGADGNVHGTTTAEAIRIATELSSRLEQGGFIAAATALRTYAQAASSRIATPPPEEQPPMPPEVPDELRDKIARAVEMERDPAKLLALRNALSTLPPSGERDSLMGVLDALIRDIQTQQAVSRAAVDVERIVETGKPAPAPPPVLSPPILPPVPALPAGPRVLKVTSPLMQGEDVRGWQNDLRRAGYSVTADGIYGSGTASATKQFQQKLGVTADGVVGPETLAAAVRYFASPPPAATPAPAPASTGQRVLKVTSPLMQGEDVRGWQNDLRRAGYSVTADGVYGSGTASATKQFQQKLGVTADGAVGPATLAAAAKYFAGQYGPPPPPAAAPPVIAPPATTRVLKVTSPLMQGTDVAAWQSVLIASGYNVKADGVYGPATADATKDWQKKRGLTADGIVGPATLAAVAKPPSAPVKVPDEPVPQPLPAAKSPREIAAEAMVSHLLALQAKHGPKGAVGKEDKNIVKRFQQEAGLTADGLAGRDTMLAAAQAGIAPLPKVMYWPASATRSTLTAYRNSLVAIADRAQALGFNELAGAIRASADAELGQTSKAGSL